MKKFKAGNVISHIYLIILTLISHFPAGMDYHILPEG